MVKCPKCSQSLIEHFVLLSMTAFVSLIVYVELRVFKKMLEEYFLLSSYLDASTFENCYKPQAEMRLVFEILCIYFAILALVITGAPSLNLSTNSIKYVAFKCLNITAIVFGPILFTLCLYGFKNFKAISSVCTLRGIKPETENLTNIMLLFGSLFISTSVSHIYVYE